MRRIKKKINEVASVIISFIFSGFVLTGLWARENTAPSFTTFSI